jgi:Ca-activated chloride channel family protein
MRELIRNSVAAACLALTVGTAAAADRAIIVLDASGSMWGQIDGTPKLEIARRTLRTVLGTVPGDMELGLIAYGHRQKGACDDIELVVPPAAGTGQKIADAADGLRFIGKTPLSEAVRQAAQSLRYTEEKATVILITDGIETCNADPCALASELEQSGVDFTAHVVGFGLSDEEGRQVACLAENTGGKYIQASDAGTLADALAETVAAAPEPEPEPAPAPEPVVQFNFAPTLALSEDSPDLGNDTQSWTFFTVNPDGSRGSRVRTEYNAWKGNLEPGDYIVVAGLGRAETEQRVTIEAGKTADPHFILNAGRLVLRPRSAEGEEPNRNAVMKIAFPGGQTSEYGESRVIVPAGEITIHTTIGQGSVTETFNLTAGHTLEKDIIVGIGRAVVTASYVAGMAADSRDIVTTVYKAAKKIDGSRERIATEYGTTSNFDLPAGDYVAQVKLHAAEMESPFSVKVGERIETDVVLNAGVLAVTAPGAKEIRIYKAQKDLQGNRVRVANDYKAEYQTTVNEGEYVAVAHYEGDKADAEKTVAVKAGERTEISIP